MRLPATRHGSRIDAARALGVGSIATAIRTCSTILGAPPKAAGGAAVIGQGVRHQP